MLERCQCSSQQCRQGRFPFVGASARTSTLWVALPYSGRRNVLRIANTLVRAKSGRDTRRHVADLRSRKTTYLQPQFSASPEAKDVETRSSRPMLATAPTRLAIEDINVRRRALALIPTARESAVRFEDLHGYGRPRGRRRKSAESSPIRRFFLRVCALLN